MDPSRPESFKHRTEHLLTGRSYHFVDQLPSDYDSKRNPTLLCIHGFPDLWYGWRYQIGPWVRRGYRVVVPDMLGYGGTSKPVDPTEYTTKKICADLSALLDLLGVEKAVVIGHDWGSAFAGRFALWHSDRILALVMLSVPYSPPQRHYMPLEQVVKIAPNLGYQLFFASAEGTKIIDSQLEKFISFIFPSPGQGAKILPEGSFKDVLLDGRDRNRDTILSPEEFSYYHKQFAQGMNGPLNYYRTTKHRFDEEKTANLPANMPSELPYLFIYGTSDGTVVKPSVEKAKRLFKRYQEVVFENRGHWLMVEAKDEVTEKIADWLDGLTSFNLDRKAKL